MLNELKRRKKIIVDMAINILGTGIPLLILQLFIYPIVGKRIDENSFGLMQSMMSVVYLVAGTLGGTLCTTRLVKEYDYNEQEQKGDYNIIMLANVAIIVIMMPIVTAAYLKTKAIKELILITVLAILNGYSNYIEVGLRIVIDYNKIFVNKIVGGIGYVVGFGLFWITNSWEYIFIVSFLLQIVYCLFTTNIIKEPYKMTPMFKGTTIAFGNYTVATLLAKSLTYFDKLLLYPLLGGEAVSVYFAANIFGKLILQALEPITNVILSYLSKRKSIDRSIWKLAFMFGIPFCVIMYFVCLLISKPILNVFYAQWAVEALKLVPIATLTLTVSSFLNILYPLTLKALASWKQIIINGTSLVVYVVSASLTYSKYGLFGCSASLLVSYIVKLILIAIFCIGDKNEKKEH